MSRFVDGSFGVAVIVLLTVVASAQDRRPSAEELERAPSRLPDVATPLRTDLVPERPAPLIELGDPFLGVGPISPGFEGLGGARWNPTFQVYGTWRTAAQVFDAGDETFAEIATRLDLFGSLGLTPTERLVVGFRPFDHEGREFLGFNLAPEADDGFENVFDARLSTLFFEGDFGEIFSDLDPSDEGILDFGFAVGRQPVRIQNGVFIEDGSVDGVGIIRNTLRPSGFSNLRLTGFAAWNNLHRSDRRRDDSATLTAFFSEADIDDLTLALDLAWISAPSDTGDAFFAAASSTQRIGHVATTFRLAASWPLERETPATEEGYLLLAEASWSPSASEDIWYLNGYLGINDYSSVLRSPDAGGPLARVGILYAAQGLGRFGSALSSEPGDSVGIGFGRQFFWDDFRQQLVVELGGRIGTRDDDLAEVAAGLRYQHAFGQHVILQADAFAGLRDEREPVLGARLELVVKF